MQRNNKIHLQKNKVISTQQTKIGILGGGQLGRMLAQASIPLALDIHFLDNDSSFPAAQVSGNFHHGNFKDFDDVLSFGRKMDVVSIEIENVNVDALYQLESEGVKVYPQARVVETIKDKGLQKQFYKENHLASSSFTLVNDAGELKAKIESGKINYPFVQKSRTAGYDGKGVSIIRSVKDLPNIMDTPSVIEDLVSIEKELAVTIGRNAAGQQIVFPVVEMAFNVKGNLLDYLVSPAQIDSEIELQCKQIAKTIAEKIDIVGLLAVELFLTDEGKILINEVAPRTHNSGHHTIDACNYSQFEVQLKSILNLPLPDIKQDKSAIMINLLGSEGSQGPACYEGLEDVISLEEVYVHLYGKQITKPFRKMGHVTIIEEDFEKALETMNYIKSNLKIKACQE